MNEKIIKEDHKMEVKALPYEEEASFLTTVKGRKIALVYTNLGEFQFELFKNEAPKAVENFIYLSRQGYYDNVIFHRIINGFMIQTGDPTGSLFIMIIILRRWYWRDVQMEQEL